MIYNYCVLCQDELSETFISSHCTRKSYLLLNSHCVGFVAEILCPIPSSNGLVVEITPPGKKKKNAAKLYAVAHFR